MKAILPNFKPYIIIDLYCFFFHFGSNGNAQKHNSNWVFGANLYLQFTDQGPQMSSSNIEAMEGTASLSDEYGNLLFYTNGSNVWNKLGRLMQNSTDLKGNQISSNTQGVLITPSGKNDNQYYLFVLDAMENEGENKLYYSIIDMNLDGGLGAIIPSQKNIELIQNVSEKMTATKGTDCNIWVLVHAKNSPTFYAYKIDENGLHLNPITSISGFATGQNCYMQGEMKVSPDNRYIATCANRPRVLELHKFDATTGIVSDAIARNNHYESLVYGIEFSPNSQVLYTGDINSSGLIQFDLSAYPNRDSIANSIIKIHDMPTKGMRKSPDGSSIHLINNLKISRINEPDQLGLACSYQEDIGINTEMRNSGFGNPFVALEMVADARTETVNLCNQSKTILNSLPGYQYEWSNDATTASIMVTEFGKYWVKRKKEHCFAVDTFDVINSNCKDCLMIPNAFSPNADGKNDVFTVKSICPITNYSLRIFNRWGQMVFSTDRIEQSWNGAVNNALGEQGTYFYDIYAITGSGQTIRKSGDITLIK